MIQIFMAAANAIYMFTLSSSDLITPYSRLALTLLRV